MDMLGNSDLLDQVRRAAEKDLASGAKVQNAGDVPWSMESISRQWIENTFAREGAGEIVDVTISQGSSGTSVRGPIRIERRAPSSVQKLFAKTYPAFEHRVANILSETAQAEGRFYMEIRPHLDIEVPQGAFWGEDAANFRSIVIIEDIADLKQARFCDSSTTINREEAEDAVRLLARLHARFPDKDELRKSFPWLKTFEGWTEAYFHMKAPHMQAMEVAADVIPASLRGAGEEIYDKFMTLRQPRDGEWHTLIHSDVHLGNWYKTGTGQMGLCDWQCCNIGPGARDLAYAISTLLSTGDRRLWEAMLLRLYVEEYNRLTGAALDFDAVHLQYRRYLLAALLMWTPTLCPAPNFPAMQPEEMSRLMIQRTTAAIADQRSLEAFD